MTPQSIVMEVSATKSVKTGINFVQTNEGLHAAILW